MRATRRVQHVRQVRVVLVLEMEQLCGGMRVLLLHDLLLLPPVRRQRAHVLLLLLPGLERDVIRAVDVRREVLRVALLRAQRQVVVRGHAREAQADATRAGVRWNHLLLLLLRCEHALRMDRHRLGQVQATTPAVRGELREQIATTASAAAAHTGAIPQQHHAGLDHVDLLDRHRQERRLGHGVERRGDRTTAVVGRSFHQWRATRHRSVRWRARRRLVCIRQQQRAHAPMACVLLGRTRRR